MRISSVSINWIMISFWDGICLNILKGINFITCWPEKVENPFWNWSKNIQNTEYFIISLFFHRFWSLKSDSRNFKKMLFWHEFVKNYWFKKINHSDNFFINGCKEIGPRMAHFSKFCANALMRVRLWSHDFATSQYGLTLLHLSSWSKIPCWQDCKWKNSEEKIKDRWQVLLEFLLQKIEG